MLKIGVILAALLAGGYFAFPKFRPVVIGLAPFALFALCPLAMMFGMRGMSDKHEAKDGNKNALAVLADRYAKGEISKEEFESKKKDLSNCC
jgi:uncharacterized membrane protein